MCNYISGLIVFCLICSVVFRPLLTVTSPRTEDKYHLLVRTRINLYVWFLSVEEFGDEFRRKGIVFNRTLEDLEDRAKKCESLKALVS